MAIQFALYNPAILSDEDFLSGFVAREELATLLLRQLGQVRLSGLAQHHLLIGQRGMGKTTLLRRLALGVLQDEALAKVLLPLRFREEQYNVHGLYAFWCNCLDALADTLEAMGEPVAAAELDAAAAQLAPPRPDADPGPPLALFQAWCARLGRRPLLLLDNIDLVLDGVSKQDWLFRQALQRTGGVVVIGAATAYLHASASHEGAFYDFFQIHVLERLSVVETFGCLDRLAQRRGAAGLRVRRDLREATGRIRTLCELCGGNPRTLVLLYLLLESGEGGEVMADLERLLDQVTVLYKARVEDLPPQARVVLDALAQRWDPTTAQQLAELTGLQTPAVSSQLDRLQKLGAVEKVTLSRPHPAGFQVADRFFNVWYLVRHAPRRQRARLRGLTEFLQRLYAVDTLSGVAERALGSEPRDRHADHAFRDALTVSGLCRALRVALAREPGWPDTQGGASQRLAVTLALGARGDRGAVEQALSDALSHAPSHAGTRFSLALLLDAPRAGEQSRGLLLGIDEAPSGLARPVACYRALDVGQLEVALSALVQGLLAAATDLQLYFPALRLALRQGHGRRLVDELRAQGLEDHAWPLVVALDAAVEGAQRLRDVNPEVRGVASDLLLALAGS